MTGGSTARWTHVALLRGVNVGGSNLIKMKALQACVAEAGFGEVRTYIASGNVLVAARGAAAALERRMEGVIAARFGLTVPVVLLARAQMAAVVDRAPAGFGRDEAWRYNVLFLRRTLTAARVLGEVTPKAGVDEVAAGPGVLYFATLKRAVTRSSLPRIIGRPVYREMTIRNWRTTTALAALLRGPTSGVDSQSRRG